MSRYAILPLIAALGFFGGCATEVARVDTASDVDLDGRWTDGDSRRVSEEMIASCLGENWDEKFQEANKRLPLVRLGNVVIRTAGSDDISQTIFLNDIRRAIRKSGKAEVAQSKLEAEQTRADLADQSAYADKGKEMSKEAAPDFLLKGSISVQDQREGSTLVKFYQVDLNLTDIQSGKIAWEDSKKIKKVVKNSKFGM